MSFAKKFHDALKRQRNRTCCLHWDSGNSCSSIASAHSIQKSGQLSKIAESGHVYAFSAEWSVLRNNDHKPAPKKIGVNDASTFTGFCGRHDNDLFEPIDNNIFYGDKKLVGLYSYRIICKELYEKENSLLTFKTLKDDPKIDADLRSHLEQVFYGNGLGLERMKYHKSFYDLMIRTNQYSDMRYISFSMSSAWNCQFAGAFFPDYDFCGNELQDLGEIEKPLDLMIFFTAPGFNGWTINFGWHSSSQHSCAQLVNSIHECIRSGSLISDLLFRFVFKCCENNMFRISWWDSLSKKDKMIICQGVFETIDPTSELKNNYLVSGLENISDWKVSTVEWNSP